MFSKVDELSAALVARAIEDKREDVVKALGYMVKPAYLVKNLKPDDFGPAWASVLTRDQYDDEDIRAMTAADLLNSADYRLFMTDIVSTVADMRTRVNFVRNTMGEGQHGTALHQLQFVDMDLLRKRIDDVVNMRFNPGFFPITGNPTHYNRETAILFERLNIDIPSSFDGDYGIRIENRHPWSASRFDVQVEWVGNLAEQMGIEPAIATMTDNGCFTLGANALASAFLEEKERTDLLGGWHMTNFPSHFPVLISSKDIDHLTSDIVCIQHQEVQIEGGDYPQRYPSAAFTDPSNRLTEQEVKMSMAMLSIKHIHDLRTPPEGYVVALVPHTKLEVSARGTVPAQLKTAMRFYRPEIFALHNTYLHNIGSQMMDARLYLKGMTYKTGHPTTLDLENNLGEDQDYLQYLTSETEKQYLRDTYSRGRENFLSIRQSHISDINLIEKRHKALQAIVGKPISLRLTGDLDWLKRVSRSGIQIPPNNMLSQFKGLNADDSRLRGRLKAHSHRHNYADVFETGDLSELVTKITRIKDADEIAYICGLLDRLPLIELASYAKTPAQTRTLIEHFDFTSVLKELPVKFARLVGADKLEHDLGM